MGTFPSKLLIRKGDVEIELRGSEELIRDHTEEIAKIAGALTGDDLSYLKFDLESKNDFSSKEKERAKVKKKSSNQKQKRRKEDLSNQELSLFDEEDFQNDNSSSTDILKELPEQLEEYLDELDFSYLKQTEKALLTGYHLQLFSEKSKFSTHMLTEHARNNGISLSNPSMCISRLETDKFIQTNGKASAKESFYKLTYEGKAALREVLRSYKK